MMSDVDEESDENEKTGKPLMTEGTFQLRMWYQPGDWNSIITHDCEGYGANGIAPVNGGVGTCNGCDEVVPEALAAAWILHNFDAIQRYNRGTDQ